MKKQLIAVTIIIAFQSTTAFTKEIYADDEYKLSLGGRVHSQVDLFDGNNVSSGYSRLSVSASAKVNESMYGYGFIEKEFAFEGNEGENRDAYAGLSTDYGNLQIGYFDSALSQITDFTDIMMIGGARASGKIDDNRGPSSIGYSLNKNGFNFVSKIKLEDYNYDERRDLENQSYAASLVYNGLDYIKLGAGYAMTDDTDQYEIAVGFYYGDLYLGALLNNYVMSLTDFEFESEGYEFAAAYEFNDFLVTYTYNNLDAEIFTLDLGSPTQEEPDKENHAVDITYSFNNHLKAFAGVDVDQVRDHTHYIAGGRFDF